MRLHLEFTSEIERILDEYRPSSDPFDEDDPKMHELKTIIFKDLTDIEKRLIILYADTGSFRKVAEMLQISPSTIYNYINSVRKKIRNNLHVKSKDSRNLG